VAKKQKPYRQPKRIPLSWALAILCVVFAIFAMLTQKQKQVLRLERKALNEAREEKNALEVKYYEMVSQIERAQTDEFVANEARTKYGYLADGEIRFIITNPSVLWGEEGPPEGWKNPNEQ
jgi:cell division protein FtsB